jgi:two-component system, response regulator
MNDIGEVEILLAEDSVTDAEVTQRALIKANIANPLLWVKDGAEALDFLHCRGRFAGRACARPRLVLLDLKMPKVDGIEVLREIRATPALQTLPVVMLTSSSEMSDVVRSYALGVNSYIVKPVQSKRIFEEVARLGYYWLIMNRPPG